MTVSAKENEAEVSTQWMAADTTADERQRWDSFPCGLSGSCLFEAGHPLSCVLKVCVAFGAMDCLTDYRLLSLRCTTPECLNL